MTLPCLRERSPPSAALWAMAILIYDGLTDGGLVALQPPADSALIQITDHAAHLLMPRYRVGRIPAAAAGIQPARQNEHVPHQLLYRLN